MNPDQRVFAIDPQGNAVHNLSENWTFETAQQYQNQYVPEARPLLKVVPASELERMNSLIKSLFDKIKHGDQEHQDWLEKAINEHFGFEKIRGG